MKLLALLGIPLAAVYGERLTYPEDITSFDFSWNNEGNGAATATFNFPALNDGEAFLTDGDVTVGQNIRPIPGTTWMGNGMNGQFKTGTFNVPNRCTHWFITSAKIYFDDGSSEGCMGSGSRGTAKYTDRNGAEKDLPGTYQPQAGPSGSNSFFFQADLGNGIETNGGFIFNIMANSNGGNGCEGDVQVREYELEGTCVEKTPSPTTKAPTTKVPTTKAPTTKEPTTKEPTTKSPTPKPTTKSPTAPQHECLGGFAFGDPHYLLFPGAGSRFHKNDPNYSNKLLRFDFQGRSDDGWYYYYAPCDLDEYKNWPFFLMAKHVRWKNGASVINDNRLILNTKPTAWVLEFTHQRLKVTVGSGAQGDFKNKNRVSYGHNDIKNWKIKNGRDNRLIINYDDGDDQRGRLVISRDDAGKLEISINDMDYLDCGGKGEVMKVINHGSWLTYTCPSCMYGKACGVMGRNVRGDCTKNQFNKAGHECNNVLLGSDGVTYNQETQKRNGRSLNDKKIFGRFAETWAKETVEARVGGAIAGSQVTTMTNRDFGDMAPLREGRSTDVDFGTFEGDCQGNPGRVLELNLTCNAHTWGKYKGCCDKLGYCDLLWDACVIDMCFCPKDEEADCLHGLIHETLNDTCSYKPLFPQATRDPALDEPLLSKLGTVPTVLIAIAVAIPVLILLYSVGKWFMGKREERREELDFENENLQDGNATTGYDMSPINA